MRKLNCLFFYFTCVLIAFDYKSFAHSYDKISDSRFKIGNLYPGITVKSNIYSYNNTNYFDASDLNDFEEKYTNEIEQKSTVTNAINFASNALSNLFNESYNCDFELNQAKTKCDVAYGTQSFFELAKDTKRTLVVFGGSCDSTIKPIAESVQFFNLTLLSYTETDPAFSDQSKYYGFYRLVPSEEQHNFLRIHLIKQYNWTRIGTIYLTKAKYTLAHNLLIRELDKIVNQTVTRSILENQTSDQYDAILKDFVENDIKIIIGIFDMSTTVKLFCKIYQNGMYGENYQWIILGAYDNELFLSHYNNETDCTLEELLIAVNGTLQTRVVQYSYEYEMKLNGFHEKLKSTIKKNSEESKIKFFDREYSAIVRSYMSDFEKKSKLKEFNDKKNCLNSYFHGYAFDVLLTIFKIFSNLIESGKFSCKNLDFNRNIDWFTIFNNAIQEISFKGVTGNVTFKNGSRIGQLKLEQLVAKKHKNPSHSKHHHNIDLTESLIFVHDQNENKFYDVNKIMWHGLNPPKDQTIKIKILYKIPKGLFFGMSALATTGIILAIGFLVFNIKFREHRFIKMSSPYLNNLIIIGCLFSYTSIYFLGEYEGLLKINFFNYICVIRVWLLTIGFTLAFGAMFSKTYRVHAILTNSKLTKKVIRDYKLFGLVVALLVIDIIILVSWQIYDPLQLVKRPYDVKKIGENIVSVENLVCESNHTKIWIASLFSYKSLLILFGCFFAYETRHVTISALNDSRYIGISVYNVLIMCSAGSAISFIVDDKNSAFILITLFIFACTTITLSLVFIPKIIEVKKDPLGKKKQKSKTTFKKVSNKADSIKYANTENLDKKINSLIQDNKTKQTIIEQMNSKLEALIMRAKNMGCNYLQECLSLLNTDDIELQKLIDKLNLKMNEINNKPNVQINQPLNSILKKPSSFAKLDASIMSNSNINSTSTETKIDQNIEEKALLSNSETNGNSIDSNLNKASKVNFSIKESSKRKFNPPPHIIDLNGILNENNLSQNFTFKMDI